MFSGIWPRSGSMRSGTCSARTRSVLRTSGTGSGFLPTPTAQDYGTRNNGIDPHTGREYRTKGFQSLSTMARRGLWPTPTRSDGDSSGSRNTSGNKAHPGVSLTDAIRGDGGGGRTIPRTWATPTGQDAHNCAGPAQTTKRYSAPLNAQAGGALSPLWVEWLMGVPIAWTDLLPLEMPRFRSWLRLHSVSLRAVSARSDQ